MTLNNGCNITIGQCQQFHHFCKYTSLIEVFLQWNVHLRVTLTNNSYKFTFLLGFLYHYLTGIPANEDRGDHSWKQYKVSHRQDRHIIGGVDIYYIPDVPFNVGYHLKC